MCLGNRKDKLAHQAHEPFVQHILFALAGMNFKIIEPCHPGNFIRKDSGAVDRKAGLNFLLGGVQGDRFFAGLNFFDRTVDFELYPIVHGIFDQSKCKFIGIDHPGRWGMQGGNKFGRQIGFLAPQASLIPHFQTGHTFGLTLGLKIFQNLQVVLIGGHHQFTNPGETKIQLFE